VKKMHFSNLHQFYVVLWPFVCEEALKFTRMQSSEVVATLVQERSITARHFDRRNIFFVKCCIYVKNGPRTQANHENVHFCRCQNHMRDRLAEYHGRLGWGNLIEDGDRQLRNACRYVGFPCKRRAGIQRKIENTFFVKKSGASTISLFCGANTLHWTLWERPRKCKQVDPSGRYEGDNTSMKLKKNTRSCQSVGLTN